MNLQELLIYFESAPAARLMRAQNAPYILAFLYAQFKLSNRIAMPLSELLPALTSYREDIQASHPEALVDRSETYLADWCSGEKCWLTRFLESGRKEPMFQLTQHTESVLEFLDGQLSQDLGFVGTESRVRLVVDMLESLVIKASTDPEVHMRHLQKQKNQIEKQIAQLQQEGVVEPSAPSKIREQFSVAISLLKQLQGDFRAVEDAFKQITLNVRKSQLRALDSRGTILGQALEAEEALKTEDQGVSFYEFFRFIQSPRQQDRLREITRQLVKIRELADQRDGLRTAQRMMPLLLAEADKVTQTERRLSAALRRLVDAQSKRERQRIAELLQKIRLLAAASAENPPRETVALQVDSTLSIQSPFTRRFWSLPPKFAAVKITEHHTNAGSRREAFAQLARLHRLDFSAMRARVREATSLHGSLTLRELLEEYPTASGVIDVIGYVQIASDDGHILSLDAQEEIVLERHNEKQKTLAISVPLVTFTSRSSV